jgi:hypothetical protein
MRFATGEDKENHHQNEDEGSALNIREANAAAGEDGGQRNGDQEDRNTHSKSMRRESPFVFRHLNSSFHAAV